MAKLAIITRTKDRPLLLKRALKSIASQTFSDYEIIIVNEGGSKETIQKLLKTLSKELSNKIKTVHNKTPAGRGGAINIGIKNSSSEYILVFDDDDTMHSSFLETAIGHMDTCGCYGSVVASELVKENITGKKITETHRERFLPEIMSINLFHILGRNLFPIHAFIYRRDALKKVGKYEEDTSIVEDWDFNVRFVSEYEIHFLNKVLVYYHYNTAAESQVHRDLLVGKHARKEGLLNREMRKDLKKGVLGKGAAANISHKLSLMEQRDRNIQNEMTQTHIRNLEAKVTLLESELKEIKGARSYKLIKKLKK